MEQLELNFEMPEVFIIDADSVAFILGLWGICGERVWAVLAKKPEEICCLKVKIDEQLRRYGGRKIDRPTQR